MKVVALTLILLAGHARAESGERWDGKTVALQSAAGLGTLALGAGAMTVCVISGIGLGRLGGGKHCGVTGGVVIGLTTLVATVASVKLVGSALDGTGSVLGTSLGLTIGLGIGAITSTMLARSSKKPEVPIIVAVVLPMIAGAVIGYHASADRGPAGTVRVPLASLPF